MKNTYQYQVIICRFVLRPNNVLKTMCWEYHIVWFSTNLWMVININMRFVLGSLIGLNGSIKFKWFKWTLANITDKCFALTRMENLTQLINSGKNDSFDWSEWKYILRFCDCFLTVWIDPECNQISMMHNSLLLK